MKLKNNKGYTGIDITLSIIILLMIVPFIGGMIYKIDQADNTIKRKSYAINLATKVLEEQKNMQNLEKIISTKYNTNDENKNAYSVTIDVKDYAGEDITKYQQNLVKQINVKVEYLDKKEVKAIEVKTVVTK